MKKALKILPIILLAALFAVSLRLLLPSASKNSSPAETLLPSQEPPQVQTSYDPYASQQPGNNTPEPVNYEIDYFAIPQAIMPKITEADKAAYKAAVDAYFNYETEAEFSADGNIQSLKHLLDLCCPIFYNDVDEASVRIGGNRISWEYSVSESEHNENIAAFESIINEYLNYADAADNDTAKALLLYKLFCTKAQYDHPTEDYLKGKAPRPEKMRDKCIDIFLSGSGICQCFARGYAFLLNQSGIEAFTAGADGGVGHHEWTVLKLGGKWYYADPTWDRGGKKLNYFGMTAARRAADGYKLKNTRYFAGGDFPIEGDFTIDDTRFKPLYTGKCSGDAYEIDVRNNLILIYRQDITGRLQQYGPGTFYINAG